MRGRRTILWVALAAVVLFATGCGGGGGQKQKIVAPKTTERKQSVLGGSASAGTPAGYTATGEIVADNGFRPWIDGFGFENYGNDAGPQNMTPAEMVDLFGTQVCENGDAGNCALTPPAAKWMEVENERMAGGHCMGFSVSAFQFYSRYRDSTPYGGKPPVQIPVAGNLKLQSLIAQNWTFQDLPSVRSAVISGTPNQILAKLEDSLKDKNGELYTVAFFKRDGSGGHAVTPFAIEKNSDSQSHILIYDNNFPGIMRAITVDTEKNSWSYVGGPDPRNVDQLYDGDAQTQSLLLYPTSPGNGKQKCFFCSGESTGQGGSSTGSVGSAQQFDQITLSGDPANHGHLVLEDKNGKVSGFVNGKVVNNIPGVVVQRTLETQTWGDAPEPTYFIPSGMDVTAKIDGSGLKKADKEKITLIGAGLYAQVDDILVGPNSENAIKFSSGENGIIFGTDPRNDQTPVMSAAIQEGKTFYAFSATALHVKGGSVLTQYFDKKDGAFALVTQGSQAANARYVLAAVRSGPGGQDTWSSNNLQIAKGELALVLYRKMGRRDQPVRVFTTSANGTQVTPTAQTLQPDNG